MRHLVALFTIGCGGLRLSAALSATSPTRWLVVRASPWLPVGGVVAGASALGLARPIALSPVCLAGRIADVAGRANAALVAGLMPVVIIPLVWVTAVVGPIMYLVLLAAIDRLPPGRP